MQPHSGAQANFAVFLALLQPGDTIMGLDLSHGDTSPMARRSMSAASGSTSSSTASTRTPIVSTWRPSVSSLEHKPKLIVCGYSAYPRIIDFAAFRAIADEVGAYLLADMAHIAGLVAAGVHPSPVPHCDVVTTTTHKPFGASWWSHPLP